MSDRQALICCLGAGFGTLLDSAVVSYAVPALQADLGATTAGVQWLLAAYSLTFGLGLVPGGRLGDAFGRRGLLAAGLVVFLVGSIAAGFGPEVLWVVAGRFVQGFGAGLVSAQVLGIIQDRFAGIERVRALAAYTVAGAAAGLSGPLVAGALLALAPPEIAWRGLLLLSTPFLAATLVLALRAIPPTTRTGKRIDLDLPAVVLLGAIVVLVTLPVVDPGVGGVGVWAIVAVTAGLTVGLTLWELWYAARGRVPLFAPQLVRSAGFVSGNLVAMLWFGSILAHSTALTLFLLQGEQLPAVAVAVALIPAAVGRIVASSLSSRVFARLGARTIPTALAVQFTALGAFAATALAVEELSTFLVLLVAIETVLGLSSGLAEPPVRAVTLGFAPSGFHGVAASFLQLTQRLSATFCIALVTGLLLSFDPAGVTRGSLTAGTVVCAALSVAALVIAALPPLQQPVARRRTPTREQASAATVQRVAP